MKYATALKVGKLVAPFSEEAEEIAKSVANHTVFCWNKSCSTGGLLLPNGLVVTPHGNRNKILVHFQDTDETVSEASLLATQNGFAIFQANPFIQTSRVGHDHTSVGAFVFAYVFGELFVYEKLPPEKRSKNLFHFPLCGTPIFTRQGQVAGIITAKPHKHVIGFITDFPLPQ